MLCPPFLFARRFRARCDPELPSSCHPVARTGQDFTTVAAADFSITMGICLDTNKVGRFNEEPTKSGSWPRMVVIDHRNGHHQHASQPRTMSEPTMVVADPQQNGDPVVSNRSGPGPPKRIQLSVQRKVEPIFNAEDIPQIPIIFILGGPGSGKLTHCHRLTQIDEKLVHLNMLMSFIEVAKASGTKDPNFVPAYRALEVFVEQLILVKELKDVDALLVTGYPRNMRDVVEYLARINRIDGVILLDWSDESLERQVKFGAKIGDINPELARVEIQNHRSNIIPVAHFFDQQGHLHVVAGQRSPSEVFEDLLEEVGGILERPIGQQPVTTQPMIEDDRQSSAVSEKITADVHIDTSEPVTPPPPYESKRKESIDSVDLMIEEEIMKNVPEFPEYDYKNKETQEAEKSD